MLAGRASEWEREGSLPQCSRSCRLGEGRCPCMSLPAASIGFADHFFRGVGCMLVPASGLGRRLWLCDVWRCMRSGWNGGARREEERGVWRRSVAGGRAAAYSLTHSLPRHLTTSLLHSFTPLCLSLLRPPHSYCHAFRTDSDGEHG